MARNRRGRSGHEFGGSGEDSFVAVVVTKLTGALLFILLLTMVIMALLPKVMDAPPKPGDAAKTAPLAIRTPGVLPEAIAGRSYRLALSAVGGTGPLRWSIDGKLPDGMAFDSDNGVLEGIPAKGTPEPLALTFRVSDGSKSAVGAATWVVYQPDAPLAMPSRWDLKLPALPWAAWFRQGFGFVVLLLVYLLGQNTLSGLRRWSLGRADDAEAKAAALRRHAVYRNVVRLAGASAFAVMGAWLWMHRGA